MGRGRKPISNLNNSEWEAVFYNSVGAYVRYINNQLSKEYKLEPLSNHLKIVGGYAFKAAEYKKQGIPIIRISDFNNEQIVLKDVVYYQESKELDRFQLVEGDIIIALTGGTIAKLAIVQSGLGKIYLNQRVGKFQVLNPDEFELEYIYWLARSIQSIIKNLAWGAAIPNVSPKQIEELKFPFPTKEIQKGIVSFLNDLKNNEIKEGNVYFNEIIENDILSLHEKQINTNTLSIELTHQLTLVKQLRQSLLREAMQGKLTTDFRCAHPELIEGENSAQALLEKIKAEKKQLFKDGKLKKEKELSPVGEDEIPFDIPEGWVWCRLGEIMELLTDYHANGGYETLKDNVELLEKEDYAIMLRTTNFHCDKYSNYKYITEKAYNYLEKSKVYPGDLIMNKIGDPGSVFFVDDRGMPMSLAMNLFLLRFPDNISNQFIYLYLKTHTEYVKSFSKGSTTMTITKDAVKELLIPLPPLSEQQAIVSKLDVLMRTCDELEASIRTSQQQNEMLLREVLREALESPN